MSTPDQPPLPGTGNGDQQPTTATPAWQTPAPPAPPVTGAGTTPLAASQPPTTPMPSPAPAAGGQQGWPPPGAQQQPAANPYGSAPGGAAPALPSYGTPASGYGTPGYGAPGYGTPGNLPYASAPSSTSNTLAIVSLVCSLAGLLTWFSAIAGIVCGHIALGQMKRSGNETGRGMALAGVIVGYVITIVGLVFMVWMIWLFYELTSYGYDF